jgi:hypothetical protein
MPLEIVDQQFALKLFDPHVELPPPWIEIFH